MLDSRSSSSGAPGCPDGDRLRDAKPKFAIVATLVSVLFSIVLLELGARAITFVRSSTAGDAPAQAVGLDPYEMPDADHPGNVLLTPGFKATTEEALAAVRTRTPKRRPRVIALVWKNPFMAVGGDTFAHDMLVQSGGANPFETAARRYPRVDGRELAAARPEVVLLPTEPYAFGEKDRLELLALDCPASRDGRIHIVEGELLSWYGPRMARALQIFSELIVGP